MRKQWWGGGNIFLALGFIPAALILVVGIALLTSIGNHYAQSSAPPPVTASEPEPQRVDSKKLKKKERALIVAAEADYGRNMPAFQEKYVLTLGRTYCAIVGAGFSKADIARLYGKNKERSEAEGVNILALSKKILCPKKG